MRSWVFQKGIEKGRQEGLQEGLQEGRQEGRQEGQLEALRQSIALALSARGLSLTAARRAQLDAETRVEVLQAWFARALVAERAAQVFATR